MKLCIAALVAAFGAAGAAWAADPVPSAGGTGAAPVSTADQISAFLKAAPVPDLPNDGPAGATTSGPEERRIHGVVEVGAGSSGYRHAFVGADIPLGQTGTLSIAVDQSRFQGRYGGWRGQSLAGDLALGPAAAQDPSSAPCLTQHSDQPPAERWSAFGAGLGCRGPYSGTSISVGAESR
ncbi:MAG: hypothetical protein E7812_06240 [Phenylobacterium sp.]|nr:MAG: hypothetical protein E7812_06240 [Phenylobacterium sp.]